jgi:branched-chain amino acid transport system substrate-binding protein
MVGRRDFIKMIGGTVAGLAVGAVAGYYAGQTVVPKKVEKPSLSGEIPLGVIYASPMEPPWLEPAIRIAINEVNEYCEILGRNVKFTFLAENAEESATKALERAQSLMTRGIQAILAPCWSSLCKAILPTANERKVVLVSPGSTSPALAIPDDYLFRTPPDDSKSAIAVGKYSLEMKLKYIIPVYGKEPFGEGLYKECTKNWIARGIKVEEGLGIDPEKKEYGGEMATVRDMVVKAFQTYKKEEIGLFLLATDAVLIPLLNAIKEYPELQQIHVFDSDNAGIPTILQYAGEISARIRFKAYRYAPPSSPKYLSFVEKYKALAGFEPYSWAVCAYDAIWLMALAILTADEYSGPKIKEALPRVAENYYGASGWCALNEAGDRKYPTYEIAEVVLEENVPKWKPIGFYDAITDTIKWY